MEIDPKLRFRCGIYLIINILNGHRYIGSSVDIYNRLHHHFCLLKRNKSHNQHFQNAWNKYGQDAFHYSVLEYCTKEVRFEREQFYISMMKPEYNLTDNVVANEGHSPTQETRTKIARTLKVKHAQGLIQAYDQERNWVPVYIYSLKSLSLVKSCKNMVEAQKFLGGQCHIRPDAGSIYRSEYIVSKTKFVDTYTFRNYLNEVVYKAIENRYGKYIVAETPDGVLHYLKSIQEAVRQFGWSKTQLCRVAKWARKNNPYTSSKVPNVKFYYMDNYIAVPYAAVPIEESSEVLSGNIGETPNKDNTEINLEPKESKSSYSIGLEPPSETTIDPRVSDTPTEISG